MSVTSASIRNRIKVLREKLFSLHKSDVAKLASYKVRHVSRWEEEDKATSFDSPKAAYKEIGDLLSGLSFEELKNEFKRESDSRKNPDDVFFAPAEHSPLALERHEAPEWVKACFDESPGSEKLWQDILCESLTANSKSALKPSELVKLRAGPRPMSDFDYEQALKYDSEIHGKEFVHLLHLDWTHALVADKRKQQDEADLLIQEKMAKAMGAIFGAVCANWHSQPKQEDKPPRFSEAGNWGPRLLNSANLEGGLAVLEFLMRYGRTDDGEFCPKVVRRIDDALCQMHTDLKRVSV